MPRSLLQRSEPETITQFEAAARLRFLEAETLGRARGRKLGSIYLYGYSIEMRIKAAFFRVEGIRLPDDATTDAIRGAAWTIAWLRYLPPGVRANQHDLILWSRLLTDQMLLSRPRSTVAFRSEVIRRSTTAYAIWGESLRYRAVQPSRNEFSQMSATARWFRSRYRDMI